MNVKSGMPYITYRDSTNIKNNTMNIGVTEGLNLCLEITLPSSPDSISSCNLGHINLKKYVKKLNGETLTKGNMKNFYDFKLLDKAMGSLVENINKVIDYNRYPLDEYDPKDKLKVLKRGKISIPNFNNRPLGIGVSGLAETFALLNIAFDSDLAKELNKMIFAAMYYYGLKKSHKLALVNGEYNTFRTGKSKIYVDKEWKEFDGSPLSNGFFQFDLWQAEGEYLESQGRINNDVYKFKDNIPFQPTDWGGEGTWDDLRKDIVKDGVYNSMILAPMPTASSAQMVRNAECFEAHQTLIYARKLVHGNVTTFSEPFVEDMQENGLWIKEMIDFIQMDNGSIRYIHHFINDNLKYFKHIVWDDKFKEKVTHLQNIHRGMYEISQKDTMLMARQRGIYIDQSQSLNIYIAEPSKEIMMGIHAYSSALQLKTGMYYLRQNPASQTDRFTIPIEIKDYYGKLVEKIKIRVIKKKKVVCTEEVCIMCQ
jgi:ribonucleoside-diphosphate reductase alpha chain